MCINTKDEVFLSGEKKGGKNKCSNLGFSFTIRAFKNVCFDKNRLTLHVQAFVNKVVKQTKQATMGSSLLYLFLTR